MGQAGSRQEQFWEACSFGRTWLVRQFIEEGIDVNWVSHLHDSCPIHVASQGNCDIVQLLIDNNCNVNAQDFKGNTALHHAAMSGKTEICDLLLQNDAIINSVNRSGWTPLINSCYWCHYDVIELLILKGADISIRNNDGRTAIHELCRSKSTSDELDKNGDLLKALSLLIDSGANIDDKSENNNPWDSEADFTPLLFATYHGHSKLVECLIDSGANVNERDRNGWTSLHWAAERGHSEIVKLLLISGVHIEAKTNRGEKASELSTDLEIMKLINPHNIGNYPHIVSNGYVTTDDELSEDEFKEIPHKENDTNNTVNLNGHIKMTEI